MPNTYSHLMVHLVFSTKQRQNFLTDDLIDETHKYIAGIIQNQNCTAIAIGGVADHVHRLVEMPPTVLLSDLVRVIKSNSSKRLNEKYDTAGKFAWQTGYAAFTVSQSQREIVKRYIKNQKEHHVKVSFKEEYLSLLEKHGVAFEKQYALEEQEPDD